jgi:hypothetical protein
MRLAATVGGRPMEEMRVLVLEFLAADVYDVSKESCAAFLEPLVESWDVDLEALRVEVALRRELVAEPRRAFAFAEQQPLSAVPSGLADFLADEALRGDVSDQEIEQLRAHSFDRRQPTRLYYYRALQNLRDPIHFRRADEGADRG